MLISLFDSAHLYHDASVSWFRNVAMKEGWATCPLTENGLIRVMSQVSYPNLRLATIQVAESLALFKRSFPEAFHFWRDAVSLTDERLFDLRKLIGARQMADVYLAGLVHSHQGRLATLDSGIAWKAVVGADANLIERIPV